VETGRRNNLTKKFNDFSQVLLDTAMPARATSLVPAMIRGTEHTERPASPVVFFQSSLQPGSSRRKI
jgi:hypothetical protein